MQCRLRGKRQTASFSYIIAVPSNSATSFKQQPLLAKLVGGPFTPPPIVSMGCSSRVAPTSPVERKQQCQTNVLIIWALVQGVAKMVNFLRIYIPEDTFVERFVSCTIGGRVVSSKCVHHYVAAGKETVSQKTLLSFASMPPELCSTVSSTWAFQCGPRRGSTSPETPSLQQWP